MNAEIFAEWLRRQGKRVLRTESSYWHEQGPRIYQAFPYHWLIAPGQAELSELWRGLGAIGLRYSAPFESRCGAASYHVVFEGEDYPLSALPKKARYDVRKGQAVFRIQPLAFAELSQKGWAARRDTLERQGRTQAEDAGWWQKLCGSAADLPGFEAWAAWHADELAAALIAFTGEDCCSILYQASRSEYLSQGVNNALTFAFTQAALSRPGTRRLFYGLHSLDAPPSVDEFKFRMGYRAKAVRQRVVFHPWLRPLFNPLSHTALRGLHRRLPGSPLLAKAEGMLRFYLQGRLPLEQQEWPLALRAEAAAGPGE